MSIKDEHRRATKEVAKHGDVKTKNGILLTGMLAVWHQMMDDADSTVHTRRLMGELKTLPPKVWNKKKRRRQMAKASRRANWRVKRNRNGKPWHPAPRSKASRPQKEQFRYVSRMTQEKRSKALQFIRTRAGILKRVLKKR